MSESLRSLRVEWMDALDGQWSGPLRVRVRGGSMLPTLRPGDVVRVEPAGPDDLRPGDVVLCRNGRGALLHRFLGRTPEGWLLTQGDAHLSPDPPWPPEALLGRAVGVERGGRVVPIPDRPLYRTLRRGLRRAVGFLRPLWRWLVALLLVFLLPALVRAAVTLVSFTATPQGQAVLLRWETASEVNMLGFTVWRAESAEGDSVPISDLIPAEGDIVGAVYQYTDADVEPGRTYFYWLEAVEVTGASAFHGPVSATVPFSATATPTPTPTNTPTATPTPTPTPTGIPGATPTPTPTPTSTPTSTPPSSPQPSPSVTPTSTPVPVPTATPVPTRIPSPTPYPSPTATQAPSTPASPTPVLAATPTPSPWPTFAPVPSPTVVSSVPTSSPPTTLPGPSSSAATFAPAGAPSPPARTPRTASTVPSDSLPLGWIRVLLATGGAVGVGLILWSVVILFRSRRAG